MSNFVCFFFFPSSCFWNNNVSFKKFTSYIANLVMTNSRKNNFFWNFYLMNYWTYTLTDLQNLHGMIAQDCFEDAGTTHTTTFLQKKSIESFLFACCILWFSDQLICCLVFPADLGYIVTELLLYAFICRVYYVYVVVVVIAPYSLICENSSHFNTTPRGVRWGPAAKFRQPSLAEIYIICTYCSVLVCSH